MIRLIAIFLLVASSAFAVQPDEMLDDPVLENRARDLSQGLRCPVCRNESIDESNAELARELRILLRERLVDGDTDQEAVDFLVARYGEFVLRCCWSPSGSAGPRSAGAHLRRMICRRMKRPSWRKSCARDAMSGFATDGQRLGWCEIAKGPPRWITRRSPLRPAMMWRR